MVWVATVVIIFPPICTELDCAQNAFTYIVTNTSLKNEGWGINPDQGKVRVLENNKDGQISIAMDTWLEIKPVNPKGNQP